MNLLKIEELLPNGFHDAYMSELKLDFIRRKADLFLDVLMSYRGEPEKYKKCSLTIHNYAAIVLEPAVAYREIGSPCGLEMDRVPFGEKDQELIRKAGHKMPSDNFWLAFFVYEWNSRIVINAGDATLEFL